MTGPRKGKKYLVYHLNDFLGVFKYNGRYRKDTEWVMWDKNRIHTCPVFEDKREYIWGFYLEWKRYNGGKIYDTSMLRTGFNRKKKCKVKS